MFCILWKQSLTRGEGGPELGGRRGEEEGQWSVNWGPAYVGPRKGWFPPTSVCSVQCNSKALLHNPLRQSWWFNRAAIAQRIQELKNQKLKKSYYQVLDGWGSFESVRSVRWQSELHVCSSRNMCIDMQEASIVLDYWALVYRHIWHRLLHICRLTHSTILQKEWKLES